MSNKLLVKFNTELNGAQVFLYQHYTTVGLPTCPIQTIIGLDCQQSLPHQKV